MTKLNEEILQDLAFVANLCDHMIETGELPKDWADTPPPEGEFPLDGLHYAGMLLLTLWQRGKGMFNWPDKATSGSEND